MPVYNGFMFYRLFILFCLSLQTVFPVFASDSNDPIDGSVTSSEALQRLRAGEVLIENAGEEDSGGSIRAQVLIHGDPKTLWHFFATCESTHLYILGLKSCEVLSVEYEAESDMTLLQQVVKKSWVVPKIDYIIMVRRQAPTRVDFQLVEGNLRVMEGGWRFRQLENEPAYILTHEIRIRPSFPVPRWLLRRIIRQDVPDMLACLRGLVKGSGKNALDEDLKRCPRQKRRARKESG